MFLFQASKIEESVVLILQILKPETKIFSFLQLVALYVRSVIPIILHIAICCLINIHKKPWVDTGCSQHQDFKHINLGVLKFNLLYIN